ncbi:hypothetical protein XMM379_001017 [Aliiroseovarius sp. xm-m-379]|nr:hypothetical protein [Aliiroseovarius sp. xm-d-517]NRP24336.1 hypothetical protein [Aliiroseovarius sp. xm-m-379]NRP29852.1 hypothetical protein [Aliiroseovarius sp. xm-m-314]NRP33135.1 hypothetical protein [Aliiroseovarius sp. xm-a-104]NRP39864.1 hypothetical protein [Aliiroseovarius sp. xm-m-339-2]NRP43434.1 hypothetical protein [Aliiroseovarius sp. xm-m-378]NRP49420.1 hypothetical protein [Aliiroseovarius sp. xm-m-354]NRP60870.1 hypothetical protein [Aliiroseovarius sp. xm-a-151]NRP64
MTNINASTLRAAECAAFAAHQKGFAAGFWTVFAS